MNMEFHQPWWASAILITWERIWKSCCSSVAKLCLTLCDPMDCSTPGSPVLQSLPEFAHIELVMLSNQLNPFSFCLQSFLASGSFPTSLFFTIRWPKYWSFNFNICSSSEYSALLGWIWLVWSPCTLKSLLQHHNLCFVWVFPLDITEKPEQSFGQFNCVPWISHLSLTYPSKEECTSIPTF